GRVAAALRTGSRVAAVRDAAAAAAHLATGTVAVAVAAAHPGAGANLVAAVERAIRTGAVARAARVVGEGEAAEHGITAAVVAGGRRVAGLGAEVGGRIAGGGVRAVVARVATARPAHTAVAGTRIRAIDAAARPAGIVGRSRLTTGRGTATAAAGVCVAD